MRTVSFRCLLVHSTVQTLSDTKPISLPSRSSVNIAGIALQEPLLPTSMLADFAAVRKIYQFTWPTLT